MTADVPTWLVAALLVAQAAGDFGLAWLILGREGR